MFSERNNERNYVACVIAAFYAGSDSVAGAVWPEERLAARLACRQSPVPAGMETK